MTEKRDQRLRRQFEAIERNTPVRPGLMQKLQEPRFRMVRIPVALFLIAGGLVGFLPIAAFWWLPIGLLLLAIDVPSLRPYVSAAIIRLRRRIGLWRQRWRRR